MKRPDHIDPEFMELVFLVAREYSGWRADRYVAKRIPRLSRTRVQRILKQYAFDEDGRPVKSNRILREGERFAVYKQPPEEPDVNREFGVPGEDEWLLFVDKPARLPVHPTARYLKNTLTGLLQEKYGENRPVLTHRLDAETSGVLICAKSLDAERRMKKMFADRKVAKTYLAVVEGIPDPPGGRIEVPLDFDPAAVIKVKMWCNNPDGLPALTEYRTVTAGPSRALLELHPRTGRQHQLRAHLAHLGHPIVGDKMYGADELLFLDYIDEGPTEEIIRRAGHHRQALHAASVRFVHPFTGEDIFVESPMPGDFSGLIG